MRTIERSTAFKKDYKRELKGQRGPYLEERLTEYVTKLVNDEALPEKASDHPLSGAWAGYRDCHMWPDLVLIYSKPDAGTLRLARLGSHSELFKK
jgi:mRNA interferase YafQ